MGRWVNWTAFSKKELSHISCCIGQFIFLRKNGCSDCFENVMEFSSYHAENSLKFSKESTQPLSCKKINWSIKFGNADGTWFLSAKGTKSHQLLPNFIGQFIFSQGNGCTDCFENFVEFSSYLAEISVKFSKESSQPYSCKKINFPIKFGNSWWNLVPFF